MEEVGSYPHNLSNSSPVLWGDLIFVSTSNGQDESHVNIPSPRAPSIIALNKDTGELVWEDNSVEDRILHGQWSTPSVGRIGGVDQVVSAQGDGWIRGYDPTTGTKLWEFDSNPKDSIWPRTRNEVIATPVIYQDRVYLANGQDPEHGEGVGHFYAIDATKRGDITESGVIWHFEEIRRSISTAAIADGLVYIADFSGYLHCLDADTGEELWTHDTFAAVWGSPFVVDGRVYLGDEDGDVVVVEHSQRVVGTRRDEHGKRRLRHRRAGQRRPVPEQSQQAVQARAAVDPMRRHLAAALLVLAVAAPAAGQGRVAAEADWPQFRGNAQLTGVTQATPPAELKVLWTQELGDTVDSSPAVADGVVYVGTTAGLLVAVDLCHRGGTLEV